MKTKKLIYMVLIIFTLSACNENNNLNTKDITSENIPDEIFFKYLLDHFDTNKDGKLSQAEADAVKEINFSSDEFLEVTVKGIEYFKNLEKLTLNLIYVGDTLNVSANTGLKELYLSNTNIQYLDISMITGLEILVCNANHFLRQLIIGNNTALWYLDCSNTYWLETINVTNCKALEALNISNTNIETININENQALKELNCSKEGYANPAYKKLKELNVSNNTALKKLDCSYNEIESLDISKNTLLEVLHCEFNYITDLALSNLPLLGTLHCQNNLLTSISTLQNPELQDLDITNNKIAFLNITQNAKLRRLFCSGTTINSLDIRNTVIDSLSCASDNLKSLNAKGSQTLKWLECSAYTEIIDASESTLETINYYPRYIPEYDYAGEVVLLLNNCPNLKAFHFAQERTYPRGSVYIYGTGKISMDFSNCTSLQTFNANYISNLKIDNCPALIKELTCIGVFKDLDLSNNGSLEKLYCYSQELETINITSCTMLKEVDCFGMFETIDFSKNQNLENLRIVSGGKLLSFDIDALSNLKYLELVPNHDNITFKIQNNAVLEEILVRDTLIGNVNNELGLKLEVTDLPSLKNFKTKTNILSQLNISNCPKIDNIVCERSDAYYMYQLPPFDLGITDCPVLLNIHIRTRTLTNFTINDCPNLDTLDIAFNKLTSLMPEKNVQNLYCGGNSITSLDVSGFTRLKGLHCESNEISHLNIDDCNGLEWLDCSDNNLSSLSTDHLSKLKTLYCNKNQLSALDISKNLATDKLNCTDNQIKQLLISNKQTFSEFKIDAGTEIVYVD